MDPKDLTRLAARAGAGDTKAFGALVTRLEPDLRRYLTRLMNTRSVVDDVLQETLLRLWKGMAWLREPALIRPWAFRIATREAHRMLGREIKWEALSTDPAVFDAITVDFIDPSVRLDIEAHLASVTPHPRLVLVAHYFEGLSLADIASATGIPLGTVKSRLASGLTQLRKHLSAPP